MSSGPTCIVQPNGPLKPAERVHPIGWRAAPGLIGRRTIPTLSCETSPDMRLLYVIDSLAASGGAEQALAAMSPGLAARGISLIVQPLRDKPGVQQRLRDAGAEILPSLPPGRAAQARALHHRIRALRPDLVHTTLFESDVVGRPAARMARVPVVSSLVNVTYGSEQRRALSTTRLVAAQGLDLSTATLVTRFHAITQHVRDVMSRRLLIPHAKIDVIPRGRDPRTLGERTPARTAAVRRQFNVGPESLLLVSAARHEHQKGLDVALRAVGQLTARGERITYLIAGRSGNESGNLHEIIDGLGLARSVQLLGPRDDVYDLIAAADVFVAPSRWEGLGSAVLEAMALNAPLVVSDVPAIRETVGDENAAVLVPPADHRALAHAISWLLNDESRRRSLASAAYERFNERYTIDMVLTETVAFYNRALATG